MAGKTRLGLYGTSRSAQPSGSAPVCTNPRKLGELSLEYFGDISLSRHLKNECISGEPLDTKTARGTCEGRALGAQVGAATGSGGAFAIDCTPTTRNMSVKVYAFFPGIPGSPAIVTNFTSNPQTFPGEYDHDATGSWSISCDFEVWEYKYDLGADRGMLRVDANDFPYEPILNLAGNEIDGYGDAPDDGLPAQGVLYYLLAKVGSSLNATITVGGVTAANSCTITSGNQFPLVMSFGSGIDYGCRFVTDEYFSNSYKTSYVTTKWKINGGTPQTLGANGWTKTSSNLAADASTGAKISGLSGFGEGQCAVALFPSLRAAIDAKIMALNGMFPTNQTLNYTAGRHLDSDGNPCATIAQASLTPAASVSVVMPRYEASLLQGGSINASGSPNWITAGSSLGSTFTDQWWPQRVWLNTNRLSTTKDDTRDWRMDARGWCWKVGTLKHENHVTIDDGSSTTGWAAGANTTIATSGGALQAAVSGGTGSATRTVSPVKSGESYAFLRVRVRSTVGDNKAFRFRFTNSTTSEDKKYSSTTDVAGTWKTIDIDLLVPDGVSSTKDEQESRYPLTDLGGKPSNSGDYWGLNVIQTMLIDNLIDGGTHGGC